jgi:hypothetical protein
MDSKLGAEDILLLIAEGADGQFPLDPIRLMKGGFLAWKQGPSEWTPLFDFQPYDYGPFDSRIYRARDDLIRSGLLDVSSQGRYDRYEVTPAGRERAAQLRASQPQPFVDFLSEIGSYVTSRSFADLLREIYEAFPPFAKHSVFNH